MLNEESINIIYRHALESYPDECCGIVTGTGPDQSVHRCTNIQNSLHAEDPVTHPRDARTAYAISRGEADEIFSNARERGEKVAAFYHSHTDHEAYFSEMDEAVQTALGEPEFPEALHIVVSVVKGEIGDLKCFIWDAGLNGFVHAKA